MSVPAERLSQQRRKVNRQALARRQGLTEPLRLTEGVTRGGIAGTLRDAAAQMDETIRMGLRAGTLSEIGERQLQAVKASLEATSRRMWSDIERDIRAGILDAANLAVDQQLLREIQMGMPPGIISQYSDNLVANGLQSAEDLLSRHTNGFTLSQRVFQNNQVTVAKVGRIVDLGLAQQLSARQIALQVRFLVSPAVKGGVSYAAQRLARTEINNAHHETTIRTSRDRPWVTGYTWHLSGSHPRPDICNTYAEDNEGFFPKGEVPSKPHPQCLCYLEISQDSQAEFVSKLTSGQYDDYLHRALGVTT
jgi:hypothetical protein